MKKIEINSIADLVNERIKSGFFLNSSNLEIDNTMIIGWGGLVYMHRYDCMLVPVRHSRYTFELLNSNPYFTISIPLHDMNNQIKIAGTKSGRDMDKWNGVGITKQKAQLVNVPIVKECEIHIECKIISYADMIDDSIDEEIKNSLYKTCDLHRFYVGKILKAYKL